MDKISSSFSEFVFASDERDVVELQKANATLCAQLEALKEACRAVERRTAAEVQKIRAACAVEMERTRTEADVQVAAAQRKALEAVMEAEKRAGDAETRLAETERKNKDLMGALEEAYRKNVQLVTEKTNSGGIEGVAVASNVVLAGSNVDVVRDWTLEQSSLDWRQWSPVIGKQMVECPAAGYVRCCGDLQAGPALPHPRLLGAVAPDNEVDWLSLLVAKDTSAQLDFRVGQVVNALRSHYVVAICERGGSDRNKVLCAVLHPETRVDRLTVGSPKELESILSQRFGKTHFNLVSPGFWSKTLLDKLISVVQQERLPQYKIGVIRWISGQSENEALANDMSQDYLEFLEWIGHRVNVADARYKGGLSEITGAESFAATVGDGLEIMFHVPPMLPRGPLSDLQCLERKRFTGNDVVNIVFIEGQGSFSPEAVSSQFNHAWVVVRKVLPDRYKVNVVCKEGFPRPRPFLPTPCVFEATSHFREFLLWLLVNLERSALLYAPVFVTKARRTRATLLAAACEACEAGWIEPQSKLKSGSAMVATDLKEGKKKLRRVLMSPRGK